MRYRLTSKEYNEIVTLMFPHGTKIEICKYFGISRPTHDYRLRQGIRSEQDAMIFRETLGQYVTELRGRARNLDKFTTPNL